MAEETSHNDVPKKENPSDINSLLKEMLGKDKAVMNIVATTAPHESSAEKTASLNNLKKILSEADTYAGQKPTMNSASSLTAPSEPIDQKTEAPQASPPIEPLKKIFDMTCFETGPIAELGQVIKEFQASKIKKS